MTHQNKPITMDHYKADELTEGGATPDGAELAEQVAKGAGKVRKQIFVEI